MGSTLRLLRISMSRVPWMTSVESGGMVNVKAERPEGLKAA
jgi:hypothetical protein